jgi:hypothetical protein
MMNPSLLTRVFLSSFLALTFLLGSCSSSEESLEPFARQVITFNDFEYLGAFAPPKEAVNNGSGGKWSTGYGFGGLAMRRVGSEKRFFATTHVYSGGLVYEMKFPGLSKTTPYPQASITWEWGDIYGGRKQTHEGNELGSGIYTHGLYWDAELRRLYWSYGHWYNVVQANNPVLGYSLLRSTGAVAKGPWKSADGAAHSQRLRGGVLRIPDWFATRYTNGKTLGIGFGGYWSGVASASQGPTLYATSDPTREGVDLQTQPLLAFSDAAAGCGAIATQNVRRCKAVRNSDYYRSPRGPIGWDTDPINGRGYWTAADTIEGAAVWIDIPTKHGLIFFPTLGQGEICYCSSAITAESFSSYWYIYSPNALARVARGELQPWQVNSSSMTKVTYPAGVRVTGVVFDDVEQILYLYVYQAYRDGVEFYPLVYAYKLKP